MYNMWPSKAYHFIIAYWTPYRPNPGKDKEIVKQTIQSVHKNQIFMKWCFNELTITHSLIIYY